MKRITLRGNCLTDKSASMLSTVISNNPDLSFFSLEWNQIGSPGVIALSSALENSSNLQYIDLKNNAISDEGAASLAVVAEKNTSIKTLDLRWNQIGDHGIEVLIDALKRILVKRGDFSILLTGNPISTTASALVEKWSQKKDEQSSQTAPPNETNGPSMDNTTDHKLIDAKNADLLRQLDASALKIIEVEQDLIREQFKTAKLTEEVNLQLKRISEQSNDFRILSGQWEKERYETLNANNEAISALNSRLRELTQERDVYKDKCRKAEEEKNYANQHIEQISQRAENISKDMNTEISNLTARNSEYAISESRIKSDLFATSAALDRANSKVLVLQNELAKYRTETEKAQEDEITKLTNDANSREMILKEENSKLVAQISSTTAENMSLAAQLASADVSARVEKDKAVAEALDIEQKKSQATISEIKAHVDSFIATKAELEERCLDYVKELTTARKDNSTVVMSLTEQNNTLQQDLRQIRAKNAIQREQLTDYEDTMKKAREYDRRFEEMTAALEEAVTERKNSVLKGHQLEIQLQELMQHRSSDFNNISNRITEAVKSELESIRSSMKFSNESSLLSTTKPISPTMKASRKS